MSKKMEKIKMYKKRRRDRCNYQRNQNINQDKNDEILFKGERFDEVDFHAKEQANYHYIINRKSRINDSKNKYNSSVANFNK